MLTGGFGAPGGGVSDASFDETSDGAMKPRARRPAAFSARSSTEGSPITTARRWRPLRLAVATRLNPDGQVYPVFMPSAPSKRPISVLWFSMMDLPNPIASIEK